MKKIYIIDDDFDFLQLMGELLGKEYEISTSTRLDVESLYQFNPDLILLDNFLGNTRGERVLWELIVAVPNFAIPIIVMSGYEINPTKYPSLVKGFISKPCSIKVIKKTLEDFFAGTSEQKVSIPA